MSRRSPVRARALAEGYRSGLEEVVAKQLEQAGVSPRYEELTLAYTQPSKPRSYTPDFVLPNGIVVETKGRFVTADRQKHLHIHACHPRIDIRFVFSNANAKIGKLSKTTYANWCDHNGFQWAQRLVPREWLDEPKNFDSLDALTHALKKGSI
jgi:hypothetical protein